MYTIAHSFGSNCSDYLLGDSCLLRPSETPYTGGVFEFDIFFPPGYPRCPPKVRGVGVIYFLGQ